MSIAEKAQELGNALLETQEYDELKKAERAVEDDADAKNILEEYESIQKRAQMQQMNGQQISPELQNNLQNIQTKMQKNECIASFIDSQKNFNEVMKTVNQVITSTLQNNQ